MNIIVQPLTLKGENVITRKSLLRLLLLSALLIVLTATALAAAADDFTFTLNSINNQVCINDIFFLISKQSLSKHSAT